VPLSRRFPLVLAVAALAAALALVPGRAESADWNDRTAASGALWVGPTTAVVSDVAAVVTASASSDKPTTAWFEYGPTAAYGSRTTSISLGTPKGGARILGKLSGLVAATEYHVRLVAQDARGRVAGSDTRFVTASAAPVTALPDITGVAPVDQPAADAPPAPSTDAPAPDAPATDAPAEPAPDPSASAPVAPAPATPAPAPAAPSDSTGTPTTPALTPAPEQGQAVVAAAVAGRILVKAPGGDGFRSVDAAASVPVGSVVDARHGTIALSSETPDGPQTGRFRGAVFQVRQSKDGSGLTELHLRGSLAGCERTTKGVARAAAAGKHPRRSLWGHDRGGRFRTHGRDSVATVRGTTWQVTDRCDGTVTRVTEGAVLVRDTRTGRRTLVRAGQTHLAPHH